MNRATASLAFLIALCLSAAPSIAGRAPTFTEKDVELFRVKCGLCHGLDKTFEAFPGMSKEDRASVVEDMQGRKTGWISLPEREAITALLATNNFAGLAAAVEKPDPVAAQTPVTDPTPDEDAGDAGIELLPIAHGVAMATLFFVLGIAMVLSGLRRLFDKKKIFPRFPGAFAWKKHVLKGKIYVACALAGLAVGLSIWALDGFSIGALPHFAIGCGVGLLFTAGGAAGLRMARGKGTPALRRLHAICNLAATALFTINFVSGLSLVWPLFMW